MKAIITGASSGIGRSLAYYSASKGFDLLIVARNESALKETKFNIEDKYKVKVEYKIVDLSIADEILKFSKYLQEMEDPADMLINNAGAGIYGKFADAEIEADLANINLNILAPTALAKAFINNAHSKTKYILFVSSTLAFRKSSGWTLYGASKSYLYRISQNLAVEDENVSISVLCPGKTKTNFDISANYSSKRQGADPDFVARYAIESMLKGKEVIVPGISNKLKIFIYRYLPTVIQSFLFSKRSLV